MTVRNAVLLFSCLPEDLGWEELFPTIPVLHEEVTLLHNAIVADMAERFSEQPHIRVIVFETSDSRVEPAPPLPAKVERRTQMPGLLHKRVQEGVKEILDSGEFSSVVVFLGRNPLYPMHLLVRGMELLAQEDEVIAFGESLQDAHHPSLMFLSLKSYHPEIFEQNERWWQGGTPLLQALVDVQSLVMAVRPVRDIASKDDLGYLFHEIEREVLLKQWYPMRTYEALHRMRRKHLIPETVE
jgi:hypothetical protein